MKQLGLAKLNAFDVGTHGYFFWNFRTELESKWDYQKAITAGWLPTASERNSFAFTEKVNSICGNDSVKMYKGEGNNTVSLLSVCVLFIFAWTIYRRCFSSERRGYNSISFSYDPVPSDENI